MDHDVEPIKMAPPPSSSFANFEMGPAEPATPSEAPRKPAVSFSSFELPQSRPQSGPQSRPLQRPPPSIVFEPLKTVPHKQHFELGQGSGSYRPPHKSVSYATVEIGDHPHPAPFRAPEPIYNPVTVSPVPVYLPEPVHRPVPVHSPVTFERPLPVHSPAPVHINVPPPVQGSHLEPAINHRPDIPSVHDFSSSISSAELNGNFESLFDNFNFDNFDVSLFDIGDNGGGNHDTNTVSFDADEAGFRDFGLDFGPVLHDHPHHHKDHNKDHYSYNHYDNDHYQQQHHNPKDHYHYHHPNPPGGKYNPLPEKDYHPQLPHFQDYSRPPAMFEQHHAEQPTAMTPFLETGPFVVSGPAEYAPAPPPHKPVIIQVRFFIHCWAFRHLLGTF